MIKELIREFKKDPLTTISDFIAIIAIFAFGYGLLLLGSIVTGNMNV
tara:strand:+ start:775 stop:915 length:141 start_codon:yes stop_codon:yes gene_type:complete